MAGGSAVETRNDGFRPAPEPGVGQGHPFVAVVFPIEGHLRLAVEVEREQRPVCLTVVDGLSTPDSPVSSASSLTAQISIGSSGRREPAGGVQAQSPSYAGPAWARWRSR